LINLKKTPKFESSGLVSIEIGGMNGIEPLLVAAAMGLPVVDADLMGCAFPELQVTVCGSCS
jgi:DUF917 family protein